MDNEEVTEFSKGYDTALTWAAEWLSNTAKDWHSMGVVDDRQMLALQSLVHDFETTFLYEYRGI